MSQKCFYEVWNRIPDERQGVTTKTMHFFHFDQGGEGVRNKIAERMMQKSENARQSPPYFPPVFQKIPLAH